MAHVVLNACGETSTTTGSGALTLANTAPANYGALQTLDTAITNGDAANSDTVDYHILDADGSAWETGRGTITNSTTLTRTTVYRSTNTDNAVSLSAGTHTILFSPSADQLATAIIPSGATFPTNAQAGQVWTLTLTNRTITYVYDGTNWESVQSIGAIIMYVDGTSGSDTNPETQGDGTGAAAFKTKQAAWDVIPPLFTGDITINSTGTDYPETLTCAGKTPSGDYYIEFVGGTLAEDVASESVVAATESSSAAGSVTTADITATNTWTTGVYDLARGAAAADVHFVEISTGEMMLCVVEQSTSKMSVHGSWAKSLAYNASAGSLPTTSETLRIVHLTTTLDKVVVTGGQSNVRFKHIAIDGGAAVTVSTGASAEFTHCHILGSGASQACNIGTGGRATFYNCFITEGSLRPFLAANTGTSATLVNCLVWGNTTSAGFAVVLAQDNASISIASSNEAKQDGSADAIKAKSNATLSVGFGSTNWTKCASSPGSGSSLEASSGGVVVNGNNSTNNEFATTNEDTTTSGHFT